MRHASCVIFNVTLKHFISIALAAGVYHGQLPAALGFVLLAWGFNPKGNEALRPLGLVDDTDC